MTLPPGLTLRAATLADAELIQAQRDAMFTDMGSDAARVRASSGPSLEWLRGALADGGYSGILIERGEQIVAGAGVSWQMLPPSPRTVTPLRAYIQNVYVAPEERGQGLAGYLMQVLLDECRARGVEQVSLHASDAGKPTYDKLGFVPTNEMRLTLEPS
ncbi:GNAT family N-acetyltransferase [Deinococcus arenicola]|uniref:GNAT family N-acetyltransferase n=1 Tax=Deinococcus arenicola TaxID=2994950 RepID=A0ABU4DL73_9DEIO|nr:GNAT family N-acetyltransferase [Deinococcus sp. ZS9-10]MDV6373181.1 GNAT family N-acetyltransferase [Deinococcus sp. ZS9-10]